MAEEVAGSGEKRDQETGSLSSTLEAVRGWMPREEKDEDGDTKEEELLL